MIKSILLFITSFCIIMETSSSFMVLAEEETKPEFNIPSITEIKDDSWQDKIEFYGLL